MLCTLWSACLWSDGGAAAGQDVPRGPEIKAPVLFISSPTVLELLPQVSSAPF